MKQLFTYAAVFFSLANIQAQNPNYAWAKDLGGATANIKAMAIHSDASGNVYTAGSFTNPADFDPGVGTFTMTPAGVGDAYISKLDASGNYVWAKQIGSTFGDQANALTVDAAGNIFTTGYFSGTVDFDPGPGTYTLASGASNWNIFVLKLDAAGTFQWASAMGGSLTSMGNSIALDSLGNVYVAGYYSGTADFDPGVGTFTMTSAGGSDIFISKLNSSGNFVWAKNIGGTGMDQANGIAIGIGGKVYTTGYFSSTVDFDPGAGTFTMTSAGNEDVFISRLDLAGNHQWAGQMGGATTDIGASISVDGSGNVITAGSFDGTADFDPGVGVNTITPMGTRDVFVSKLNNNGNYTWAVNTGTTGNYCAAASVSSDNSGNIYATGQFAGICDFDPSAGTYTVNSGGPFNNNTFIWKLNAAGNLSWAGTISGSGRGAAIYVDAGNSVYTTGYFFSAGDFDPNAGVATMTNMSIDAFVHKMTQCFVPLAPSNITAPANQTVCVGSSGSLSASSSGTVNWYATPSSTTVLGSGTTFVTSTLSAGTYTFYAEAVTCTLSANRTPITIQAVVCTGINKNSGDKLQVTIYPNPSNGKFNVNLQGATTSDLELFDITGKVIVKMQSNEEHIVIDAENISAGIYFLKVRSEGKTGTYKLIKN